MSTAIVNEMKAAFDRSYSTLDAAIEICPDSLWNALAGGFPYWLQIVHGYTALEFFLPSVDGSKLDFGFSEEQIKLQKTPPLTLTKAQVREIQRTALNWANKFFSQLDDAKLTAKHVPFSEYTKTECSNMFVLTITAGHAMYHLGCCDNLLRDNGISGVM